MKLVSGPRPSAVNGDREAVGPWHAGVIASRMTGAGFGGCAVNLVRSGAIDRVRDRIEAEYLARSGRHSRVPMVQAVVGADDVAP
jgi:galactokinase